MESLVQQHWENKELVGYDCILKSNGDITLLDYYKLIDPNNKIDFFLKPICDTNINGFSKYNDDIWSEIEIHPNSISLRDETYLIGEGGMGNEGFIACIDSKNQLKWALFQTVLNPFTQVYFEKGYLVGITTSSYGNKFIVNITEPTDIKIETQFL